MTAAECLTQHGDILKRGSRAVWKRHPFRWCCEPGDVAQLVALKALRHREGLSFDHKAQWARWVNLASRGIILDAARKADRSPPTPIHLSQLGREHWPLTREPSPEQAANAAERRAAILAGQKPWAQQVLRLLMLGYTAIEIATVCGRQPQAVRKVIRNQRGRAACCI